MIGKQAGNYRVVRLLGKGGMGAVYEAEHPVIGLRVAVKILHRHVCEHPEIVERFFSEARIVASIGHENIVGVTDLGQTADGSHYLAMELLEGESLGQRMERQRPLSPALACSIAEQVADALTAAHAKGVIHRDVKPDNIFLVRAKNGEESVKVLDFGIAKLLAPEGAPSVRTDTGAALGTPYYMSPEQCAGLKDIDHRADIYGLGVVLFEMVTGQLPFRAEGVGLIYLRHLQTSPPRPRSLVPSVPQALEDVILRALAKRPEDRFGSAEEMGAELQRVRLALPPEARAAPSAPAPGEPTEGDPGRVSTLSRSVSEVARVAATSRRGKRKRLVATVAAIGTALALALLLTTDTGRIETAPEEPESPSDPEVPPAPAVVPVAAPPVVADAAPPVDAGTPEKAEVRRRSSPKKRRGVPGDAPRKVRPQRVAQPPPDAAAAPPKRERKPAADDEDIITDFPK